jgi:hypothetical protein
LASYLKDIFLSARCSLLEENEMKKILAIALAVAFAFPVAGFAVAAEKAAPAAAPAAEKAPVAEGAPVAEKAVKAKARLVSGTVEAIDAAAGTFTVKGRKGNVNLKAGEKVKLGDVEVGDKVVVKYADGTASSVKAVKAHKAKKAPATAEKPADAEKKAAPAAVPVKK